MTVGDIKERGITYLKRKGYSDLEDSSCYDLYIEDDGEKFYPIIKYYVE